MLNPPRHAELVSASLWFCEKCLVFHSISLILLKMSGFPQHLFDCWMWNLTFFTKSNGMLKQVQHDVCQWCDSGRFLFGWVVLLFLFTVHNSCVSGRFLFGWVVLLFLFTVHNPCVSGRLTTSCWKNKVNRRGTSRVNLFCSASLVLFCNTQLANYTSSWKV